MQNVNDKDLSMFVEMNLSSFVNLYNKLHAEAKIEDHKMFVQETLTDYYNSWELAKIYDVNFETDKIITGRSIN